MKSFSMGGLDPPIQGKQVTVCVALDGAHTRLSLPLKTYAPEAGHGE
jgi:hypothetical protein